MDLADYCKDPKNNPKGLELKTLAEKRKFVRDKGIKLVRHPTTKKEVIPVLKETLMLSGNRLSATRSKETEYEDKQVAKDAFNSAKEDIKVETNTQDS